MGRPTDVPHRAIVRDLTRGGASVRIDWDVRSAYDFIFSLSGDAGSTDDLPALDRAWLTDTRASLAPDVQEAIESLFESELAIHAGVLLVDQLDVRTSADVVALVESTEPIDLVRALFAENGHDSELADVIQRAIGGDASALPELDEKLPDWNRKGRIELLTEYDRGAGRVRLSVCDDGPGITPADRDQLFVPHFSTKRRGSGLGLAIVSRIVQEHLGTIRAEDNQPRGARFVVELPA